MELYYGYSLFKISVTYNYCVSYYCSPFLMLKVPLLNSCCCSNVLPLYHVVASALPEMIFLICRGKDLTMTNELKFCLMSNQFQLILKFQISPKGLDVRIIPTACTLLSYIRHHTYFFSLYII